MAEQAQLEFAVLSDEGNAVAREYGLAYALDDAARAVHAGVGIDLAGSDWQLPAPATFVIAQNGTIAYSSVSGDYRWRIGPTEVLEALRDL